MISSKINYLYEINDFSVRVAFMAQTKKNIVWFRQDLRLSDNPALFHAVQAGDILPIYIYDNQNPKDVEMGAASKLWLHHSLSSLNHSLNGKLCFFKGDPLKLIPELCEKHQIDGVYWNRCYEPWRSSRDKKIKEQLKKNNISTYSFNGSLLWEPWEIAKKDGTPYKVFTPFYKKGCLEAPAPHAPYDRPEKISYMGITPPENALEELCLTPNIHWDQQMLPHWEISEEGAQTRLEDFFETGLTNYKEGRNFPAKKYVSRLSPYLQTGEISPHQIWDKAHQYESEFGASKNLDHFKSELGWREFSYSLLYYNPKLPWKNLQSKFDAFPWKNDPELLAKWQKGQTGYPIVDAGMRELWQTGYMHNRVRMIVGSFLVKNLLLHWHHGEAWFWDCLFDADLANNSASWQWIAGCGADAAPYFRIFNPITQGEKFDPEGNYIRKFLPELADLPTDYLFKPWEAPTLILQSAGVILDKTYPRPMVDLKRSREKALEAYQQIKQQDAA